MMKRFRPTIVAFLVLVILLVYANYYETEEILLPGMQKPMPVLNFSADKIDLFLWQRPGTESIRIARENHEFKLVEPGVFPVENAEIDGLIKHFVELKYEMIVQENAIDASAFGIGPNSPMITLGAENQAKTLVLGSKSPVGGSYYLAIKDQPAVYLVPSYIHGDFFKSVADLRRHRIFETEFGNIDRIEIGGEEPIILSRKEAIDWYIEKPVHIAADGEEIAVLIQTLQDLTISRFVEDNPQKPEDWGFAKPSFLITMKNGAGKVFALETGETAGTETYFRLSGNQAIHAVSNSDLRKLKKGINDLRSKGLPELKKEELAGLELVDATGTVYLVKSEKNWEYDGKIVDAKLVEDFFEIYEQQRVSMFLGEDAKEKNGFGKDSRSDSFKIKFTGGEAGFLIGTLQGINLSILHNGEILVVKKDLQVAFSGLIEKVRESVSLNPVVAGDQVKQD